MPSEPLSVENGHQLRDAFGLFATGVVIVTAMDGTERLGATVSSFTSVSLDPPLISFSLARTAKSFAAWNRVSEFAVSVLAETQSDLSTRFARSLGDKWTGVGVEPARAIRADLISGSLLWLECKVYSRCDGGDHVIILGELLAMARADSAARPLLFYGGAYRHLSDADREMVPESALWLHGW
ncbi:flavin reductase (DIM6/NTAB) family NADH-FMN oxidoreductase RutF [Rhodoligotrophos appendicifer]|uniref:flavin reductase family protein n=1 Tax=Rhodoligotrophos appendicifer TaxID=987056 RepID=UPI00118514B6|nr:flavin reductase family protein [Rhodoligotrophos appendicifer]